jgi:hypothetical protein
MLDATHKAADALRQPGNSTDSGALARVQSQALGVLDIVEGADMPPTSQAIAAAAAIDKQLAALLEKRSTMKGPVTPQKK